MQLFARPLMTRCLLQFCPRGRHLPELDGSVEVGAGEDRGSGRRDERDRIPAPRRARRTAAHGALCQGKPIIFAPVTRASSLSILQASLSLSKSGVFILAKGPGPLVRSCTLSCFMCDRSTHAGHLLSWPPTDISQPRRRLHGASVYVISYVF